jgi:hypothetical protein
MPIAIGTIFRGTSHASAPPEKLEFRNVLAVTTALLPTYELFINPNPIAIGSAKNVEEPHFLIVLIIKISILFCVNTEDVNRW